MGNLRIKHAYFLPSHFRLFGLVLILLGFLLPVKITNPLALYLSSFGCIIIGLLFVTTRYGLLINPVDKKYMEYLSVFGLKRGHWTVYDAVEKIFVNSARSSQTLYTRSNSRLDVVSEEYIAFLKFADGSRIELDEDKDKQKLMSRLDVYSKELQTIIADNTAKEQA